MRALFFLLLALDTPHVAVQSDVARPRAAADCREWTECRRLALEAAAGRDYERFHDLAWRAVQTGPPRDPALMYLLARAQVLSGRPHDALIMIQRLAEMGVPTDASTNAEFERMRALPGWPDVAALVDRVGHGGDRTDSSLKTPAPVIPARESLMVEDAVRISTPVFVVSGLAYDAVSGRYVAGDLHGRKLIIVQDGADHAVNLVRAESAGFHEIRALEIDTRRGDLWVATATPDDEQWSLHRLQLVSGRPLNVLPIDAALGPMRLVDLAVTPNGTVLAVDAAGERLLELRPKGTKLQRVLSSTIAKPASIAVTDDEVAYIAGSSGLVRVDLRSRTAAPVSVPPGIDGAAIERIRWHRNALLAVMRDGDGSRHVARLQVDGSGLAITAAETIAGSIPGTAGPVFLTVSGDDLSYVVADGAIPAEAHATPPRAGDFIVRRIRLR